jgi:hypothetical protein
MMTLKRGLGGASSEPKAKDVMPTFPRNFYVPDDDRSATVLSSYRRVKPGTHRRPTLRFMFFIGTSLIQPMRGTKCLARPLVREQSQEKWNLQTCQ